jgi:hypothetical protein
MFSVKLAGFGASDAGGPYREVLSMLGDEVMTPHPSGQFQRNPLFQALPFNRDVVMPNPALTGSLPMLMLEFFGKLLAFFTIAQGTLAIDLPALFWKLLLQDVVRERDLASLDRNLLRNTEPAAMDDEPCEFETKFPGITAAAEAFLARYDHDAFLAKPPGDKSACSGLSSDGEGTSDQRSEARQAALAKFLSETARSISLHRYDSQIAAIRAGFTQIVPSYALHALHWKDLSLKVCGVPVVSTQGLKDESDTSTLPSHLREMLWKVVAEFTDEERSLLLRFACGQSRLPLRQPLKIQERSGAGPNSFPTSSTCFFALNIPPYTSDRVMSSRILYAVRQCQSIDADGVATEGLSEL